MKRISLTTLIMLLILPAMGAGQEADQGRTIYLASNTYPPYHGETMKNQGGITVIVREAFKRVGYNVDIKFFPWMRAHTMAKNGLVDGNFAAWNTPERERHFHYSDPIIANDIVFFKRKDHAISFKTYAGLKSYRIGVVLGYANPAGFDAAGLRTIISYNDMENMGKLVNYTVDMALADKAQGQYILNTKFPDMAHLFGPMEPPLETKDAYLIISRKTRNPLQKIADFNQGLEMIKEDGTFAHILKEYGL